MPPHQDLALPTSPGALQGSGSLGVSSLKNYIYLFISTTFQSFVQVWLRACSAAAHCAGLREAWRWCVSALLPFFGRGLLWLVSLPTLLCTLPLPLTHQYSDHLHAQDQLCTRPISIRKLLKLHSKTSTTKADSNLDEYLIILFLPRFNIKSCKSVEVEGSCADDACLEYGRRRLQPSFHLLPGQQNISQLGTNLIGLQGVTISIWTTLWCAATSNYLLGGLSAVGAVCGVVMAWGLAGAFSGWGLVVLPCHSSSRFCSAGPLVWCPCKSGAALWPIDFALVDFLCTPVALAKQSLSFLKNPMGC